MILKFLSSTTITILYEFQFHAQPSGEGNNGILVTFQHPVLVCKSIAAPPRGPPPRAAGMCILLVMPAVPKLLWAIPPGLR